MGYRIDYQPVRKVRGLQKRTCRFAAMTGAFVLLFLLGVNVLWPEGREMLRGLLFSGDYAVTAAAMEDFEENLEAGLTVKESVSLFVRQVLEGSGFAPD